MAQRPSRDLDKFVIRMPPGMRERVKAKADRANMSMNEAIVWCLNSFFPAPQTLEDRVEELAEMVAMLKEAGKENETLDAMINKVHHTIIEVTEGKLKSPPDFKKALQHRFERWDEERAEDYADGQYNPFEDPGGDLDDEDPKF